jgi:NAD(P)-dependent dehydrogenase (short-subunit alcohol dehydrogenase family)
MALSAGGAQLGLIGRNRDTLDETRRRLPAKAIVVVADVSDEASVAAAFSALQQHSGPVDILVNNAGIAAAAPFRKTDLALWRQTLEVNLTGSFLCMRAVIESMAGSDYARIINIGSTASRKGYPYVSAYCASKHGLLGLTRSVAREYAASRLTVNAVCPGYLDTDMTRSTLDNIVAKTGKSRDDALQSIVAGNPQKRLIGVDDVVATVLWLCSESACSVTGQAIMIDGGELS